MIRIVLFAMIGSFGLSSAAGAQPPKSRSGWLGDFESARAEAKRTGKPIFVVIRCEPCEECREFDARVMNLDPKLGPAVEKFVRVRLTRLTGLDLRLFDFDFDNTWFAFLMNAEGHVYGRYGGRDESDAANLLSLSGLRFALEAALEAHEAPPKTQERVGKAITIAEVSAGRKVRGNCVHCHNVNEFNRADLMKKGAWDRDMFWVYPRPENVGLTLDLDEGNRVRGVRPESPAAKLGIKENDRVVAINATLIASGADASYALHHASRSGKIPFEWTTDGARKKGDLEVVDGWRQTDLGWRPSLLDFLARLEFSGADLGDDEKKALGLDPKRLAFRQDKFTHSTLKTAGVLKDDILIGVDGQEALGPMTLFNKQFRGRHVVGDRVTLNLVRDGKRVDLPMTLK
jgi:hypothetical protein